ncbi:hypothetical protein [Frankia sp. R82]|uniref:hypothetical protein n=1 Tax=Frankia sp. R82 TaxID=2950553 RepID=UPI0020438B0C|nr:hypothetical protein [Frankia sp. R82]MCM3885828.1 hypothetical protein [Frankia sp. R82]
MPPTGTDDSTAGADEVSPGTCTDDAADCPAQPSAPAPPSAHTTPTAPSTGGSGGGITGWIANAINGAITAFFRTLVTAALNPLLDLLGRTLLTTPEPSQLPAIGELWSTSWAISITAYGTLVMFGGIAVMSLGTVQSRISIKELAPRIPIGFLASGLSQFLAGKAIQIANAVPGGILGQGLNPDTAAGQLKNVVLGAIAPTPGGYGKSIFVIFLGLFLAGSVVVLLCTYIARITIEVALIGAAPLALAGHGHPLTEKVAFWWWRAFFGCLGIQIAQSFILIASFKVFFTPGGFTVFGPSPDGVVNLLAAITLIYFLFKIPFWMMPRIGQGGSGILGRVVRAYITGRALGLLGGGRLGRGRTPIRARRSAAPTTPRRPAQPPIPSRRQPPRGRTTPQFLQPLPAVSMHHRANGKATGPVPPAVFRAPATPGADPDQNTPPRPRPTGPPGMPVFRSPDSTGTPPAASTPTASATAFRAPSGAPTRVRFQPPGPEPTPSGSSTPIRPRGPVAPVRFRPPDPARPVGSPPRVAAPGRRARTGTAMPVLFSSPAPGRVSPPMPPPPPLPRTPAPQQPRRPRTTTPRPTTPPAHPPHPQTPRAQTPHPQAPRPQTPRSQAPRPQAPRPQAPRRPAPRGVPMPRFTAPPPPGGPRP